MLAGRSGERMIFSKKTEITKLFSMSVGASFDFGVAKKCLQTAGEGPSPEWIDFRNAQSEARKDRGYSEEEV